MLLLTAFIEVAPSDREAIHAALTDVIASTRAEEGCEDYGCYEAWMNVAGPKMKSARGFLYDVASSTELRPR